MTINYFAEMLTTFIEIYLLLSVFSFFFNKRYNDCRHTIITVGLTVLLSVVTLWLNAIQLFFVPTAYVWITIISLFGLIIYRGNLLKLVCVSIVYVLLVSAFDFFCFSVMEFIFGFEGITFTLTSKIGWFRTIYIVSVKLFSILLYLLMRIKIKSRKYEFGIGSGILMSVYCLFCLSCMQSLFEAVAIGDAIQMRRSVLLAWLFIMLCAISILFVLSNRSRLKAEKYENSIITKQIEILENDNKQLNSAYEEIAKMSHDFNNQIRTIGSMAADTDNAELKEYVSELLKDFDDIKIITYTGIDSIDAVINRKQKQAKDKNITTSLSASYSRNYSIRNIDICVILANLFDNALEACEKIAEEQDRFIRFNLHNTGDMIVIKMENSFNRDSSIKIKEGVFITTKAETDTHGYGLKIINSLVEKYQGVLDTSYEKGVFSVYILLNSK